jgi:predicted nucleotidyltransferase
MNTQQEIITFLRENKQQLFSDFKITKIGIFGSFARNEQDSNSDVDIIFDFEKDIQDTYSVKNSLKNHLSSVFERSVDLAREKYLKPYAKKQILNDVIYI